MEPRPAPSPLKNPGVSESQRLRSRSRRRIAGELGDSPRLCNAVIGGGLPPAVTSPRRVRARSGWTFAFTAILTATQAGLGGHLGAQGAAPELALDRSFLRDLSSWRQHVVQDEDKPVDKRSRGVFPVGDGSVFTYMGLGAHANTMQALTGPHYQTAEVNAPKGHYGELSLHLLDSASQQLRLPQQSVWRVRGANIVITEDRGAVLSLLSVNWATRPMNTIFRWVEIRNRSDQARPVRLEAEWERGSAGPSGQSLVARYAAKGFEAELSVSRPAAASDKRLVIDLGTVDPGATAKVVLAIRTKKSGEPFAVEAPDEPAALAALDACHRQWRERLRDTTTVGSDHGKLADLLEDWKILMLVQRSEPSGAVSPMVNYRGSWVRDNNGPLLAFLRYGLFDEARAILDYVHDATVVTGRLNNHVPLDLDVSRARQVEKTVHWEKLQIPNTELPAWIILQHEWYYRATWDVAYIAKRWPFLAACYRAMQPGTDDGMLPTHGDETYLHGAFFSLWPDRLPDASHLPADSPQRRARSLDSSLAFLIAIAAMGEMAEDVDKLAAAEKPKNSDSGSQRKQAYEQFHLEYMQRLEKAFWLDEEHRFAPFLSPVNGKPHTAPYGPVNLRLQWIGFTYAMGEKNKENLRSTLEALWKDGARIGMTPTVGHTVGHLQGYLLYNLCDLDDKRRNEALVELLELAEPAGEWAELYDAEGRPIGGYDREWPNRLRPWESGINIDAIFFALNGIRYVCCPGWSKRDQRLKLRLPPGSRWLKMKRVRHDGHRCDILLDEVFVTDVDKDQTGRPVRKMRFRVIYDQINEQAADISYVDCAINVGETLYVRYPTTATPVLEQDEWPVDKEVFLPDRDGPGKFSPKLFPPDPRRRTCAITARPLSGQIPGCYVLDTGLPLTPQQFSRFFVDPNGERSFDRILLDDSAMRSDRQTFKKRGFFQDPAVVKAMADFQRLGGEVLRPAFFRRLFLVGPFAVDGIHALEKPLPPEQQDNFRQGAFPSAGAKLEWKPTTSPAPRVDLLRSLGLASADHAIIYAAAIVDADRGKEAILKIGSDDGVAVWVNGKQVALRKVLRVAGPDQDEVLIRLEQGENRLLFKIYNEGGGAALYARLADSDGLPLSGVRQR